MANFTNSGLASYCEAATKMKTAYMMGGLFREVTTAYINDRKKAYPSDYPDSRVNVLKSYVGKGYYGCDCIGLIKSYYFGGVGSPNYDPNRDKNVDTMYAAATTKGSIATFDYAVGRLVMTESHVGVYIGNNKVVECTLRGSKDGVVETNFNDVGWTKWCQCPYITDDTSTSTGNTTQNVKNIYHSVGVAAMRTAPSTTGSFITRCTKGGYYVASQIVSPSGSKQKWFKHADTGYYSAITDTDDSTLFTLYKTYTVGRANSPVNVRTAASISSSVVTKLATNTTVYLTGKTTVSGGYTWAEIVYNGSLCWCDKQWINS